MVQSLAEDNDKLGGVAIYWNQKASPISMLKDLYLHVDYSLKEQNHEIFRVLFNTIG